jgi:hypothetical protein
MTNANTLIGQRYARKDGIVYIFGCEDSRYRTVARTDRDEERNCSAKDLTAWKPRNGERVTEIDNEGSPVGIVVEAGELASLVVWGSLRRQVSWKNSCLEPIWIG